MRFNYRKLLGRIIEKLGSQAKFAEALGLSERTVSLKLNNKIPFKQNEICEAASVLDIPDCELGVYFFTLEVQ